MHIILAADHAGFQLKEHIKQILLQKQNRVSDVGANVLDPGDDYPAIANRASSRVLEKRGMGIFVCGSGVGMSIVANRVRGIRACLAESTATIKRARTEDDVNVLVLGSKITDSKTAERIVATFLKTSFSRASRHVRRLKQIDVI